MYPLTERPRGYTHEQLETMTEAELDELVIDLKLQEASCINNSGPGGQIRYISDTSWAPSEGMEQT